MEQQRLLAVPFGAAMADAIMQMHHRKRDRAALCALATAAAAPALAVASLGASPTTNVACVLRTFCRT